MSVTILERGLDGVLDLAWFGLPSSWRGEDQLESLTRPERYDVWGLEMSTKSDKGHDSPSFQLCDSLNWHFAFRCGDVYVEVRPEGDQKMRSMRYTISRRVTLPCPCRNNATLLYGHGYRFDVTDALLQQVQTAAIPE